MRLTKFFSKSSPANKRKRENGAELAEALREMNNSKMQTELAKKKLAILERKEKRIEKEEERKKKEEERKERDHLFQEWERIQASLRQLRKDMHDEPDGNMKADIKSDIVALMKRKKEISIKLGLII